VHNINTRNKHHLHRPVANPSCLQKGASYSGIRIFNSLPRSIRDFKYEKTQFKVALKKFLNAHSFYSVDEFFTCTDDIAKEMEECQHRRRQEELQETEERIEKSHRKGQNGIS
jgi:hypothetical protein